MRNSGFQRVLYGDPFKDRTALLNVLAEDSLASLDGDAAVPDAIGIDDEPGAVGADAEALGLGPHDFEAELAQFGSAALEMVPDLGALFERGAFGAEAEEEVGAGSVGFGLGEAGGDFGGGLLGHGRRASGVDYALRARV